VSEITLAEGLRILEERLKFLAGIPEKTVSPVLQQLLTSQLPVFTGTLENAVELDEARGRDLIWVELFIDLETLTVSAEECVPSHNEYALSEDLPTINEYEYPTAVATPVKGERFSLSPGMFPYALRIEAIGAPTQDEGDDGQGAWAETTYVAAETWGKLLDALEGLR
jgi:hypothetical protein